RRRVLDCTKFRFGFLLWQRGKIAPETVARMEVGNRHRTARSGGQYLVRRGERRELESTVCGRSSDADVVSGAVVRARKKVSCGRADPQPWRGGTHAHFHPSVGQAGVRDTPKVVVAPAVLHKLRAGGPKDLQD